LFLNGQPIEEPIVGQVPFVMNTWAEIDQAMDVYRKGRMGRLAAHA
jgi:quercetin 2,3-dioxygenase